MKIWKAILFILELAVSLVAGIFVGTSFSMFFTKQTTKIQFFSLDFCISKILNDKQSFMLFIIFTGLCFLLFVILQLNNSSENYNARLYQVTPNISIPRPCGQYQYGSAWWMSKKDFQQIYKKNTIDRNSPLFSMLIKTGYDDLPASLRKRRFIYFVKNLFASSIVSLKMRSKKLNNLNVQPFSQGGLVVAYEKVGKKEHMFYIDDDTHTLIIGATRCGKTRGLVIQSIVNLALAGESIFISDPKGEIFQYTSELLKKLGYNVIVLDFKNMSKSMSYNLLQPIIDQFKQGNTNKAIQICRDIANILVGEKSPNAESIWHDGQLAVVQAAIIATVYDNMDKPENQNLPYVYEFITRMCAERKGQPMLLQEYLNAVGEEHPANLLLAQANVAPSKTRGSFYTSAATCLALYTDKELYHILKKSDFNLVDLATKKTAMFVILPDDKTTFHTAASIIVSQLYEQLVEYSDVTLKTGRLPRRVNFILDEFGNFPPIKDMDSKLTVGGGRGIRFNLFVQSLSQLDKYDEKIAKTLKGNCQSWIYLLAPDKDTKEEVVHKLGSYTTSSYSLSSSKNSAGSASMQLIKRELLTTEELGRLKRPHQLVMGNEGQKVCYAPDLSKYSINAMLGLGGKKHNEEVREYRESNRETYNDVSQPVNFYGIWSHFDEFCQEQFEKNNETEGIYIE